MTECTWFERFKTAVIAWLRKFFSTYKAHLKRYIAEQVDAQADCLLKAVSEEIRKQIKDEVIAATLEAQADIYTEKGVEIVNALVEKYIDRLAGE